MKAFLGLTLVAAMAASPALAAGTFETDVLPTSAGDLKITFIGHASLMFEFGGKVIYSDPVGQYGDLSQAAEGRSDPGRPTSTRITSISKTIALISKAEDKAGPDPALRRQARGRDRPEKRGGDDRRRHPDRGGAGLQHRPHAFSRRPLPPEGGRQRLHPDLRRQAGLYGRGHGEHPGDEGTRADRLSPFCR